MIPGPASPGPGFLDLHVSEARGCGGRSLVYQLREFVICFVHISLDMLLLSFGGGIFSL